MLQIRGLLPGKQIWFTVSLIKFLFLTWTDTPQRILTIDNLIKRINDVSWCCMSQWTTLCCEWLRGLLGLLSFMFGVAWILQQPRVLSAAIGHLAAIVFAKSRKLISCFFGSYGWSGIVWLLRGFRVLSKNLQCVWKFGERGEGMVRGGGGELRGMVTHFSLFGCSKN